MSDDQTKTQHIQEPEKVRPQANLMAVDENRLLTPTTSSELSRFLSLLAEGGAFPDAFETQAQRVAVYQMARSLMGDQWQLALNHIASIKGRLTIYGELPRAIAEQTGQVEEFRVFTIDAAYREINVENKNLTEFPWAGVCEVKRKGRALKQYTYTIDEAKHAGQYPAMKFDRESRSKVMSADAPWNKYTRIMLMRKAQAMAVKFEFPDAILGTPVAEYDDDIAPDLESVRTVSKPGPAETLNKRFGGLREQDN